MAAVVEYGTAEVQDPDRVAGVRVLAWTRQRSDCQRRAPHRVRHRHGRRARVDGCWTSSKAASGPVLAQWIQAQPEPWRDLRHRRALDPFRGYATALRTGLPRAVRVLDAFHVTRLGFAAVDDVRRRVQQESTGPARLTPARHRGAGPER